MLKLRTFVARLVVFVATILLAASVILLLSGFQDQPYPPTLCEALAQIGTAVFIEMALGAFIAMCVEYWPAWEGLPTKLKRPIVVGFCLVVPVISLGARGLLCGAVIDQNTIYLAAAAGAFAFMGSQFAHIYKLPSA